MKKEAYNFALCSNWLAGIAKLFRRSLAVLNFSFKGKSPVGETKVGDVYYKDFYIIEAKSVWRRFYKVVRVVGVIPESHCIAEVFILDSPDYPKYLETSSRCKNATKLFAQKLFDLQSLEAHN
jgi:hypothetical protein